MNVTIHLEKDDPIKLHLNGPSWASAMWDFDQFLRSKIKYGCPDTYAAKSPEEIMQLVRESLCDFMITHNVSFEDFE
jgi:hypothetical protein